MLQNLHSSMFKKNWGFNKMFFLKELYFKHFHRFTYLRKLNGLRSQWFIYNHLKHHLSWKDNEPVFDQVVNPDVTINKTIWIYWKQGLDNAPLIVKKCVASVKEKCSNYSIVILDEKNLHSYVKLPDYIEQLHEKGEIKEAHYSDLVRTQLLVQYGGIWCDATCFFSSEIPDHIEKASFFMFSRLLLSEYISPIEGSNWFIKSEKDNLLLKKQRNFLFAYFKKYDYPIHYFLFHIVMGLIIHNDLECAAVWENKPYICNMNPHVLFFSFAKDYTDELLYNCMHSCFVHKLTYKYDEKNAENPHTILHYFLEKK